MKVSKRERSLLVVVLLLAVVSVYYLLFLKPYMAEISELKIDLASNETQVQTYSQLKSNIDVIDAEIMSTRAEIEELSSSIPTGFDQPLILVYLEDTLSKYARKEMFSFGVSQQVGQMMISPVTITMVTTYGGLKGFIEEVTTGEYIISVTSIDSTLTEAIENTNVEIVTTIDGVETIVETPAEPAATEGMQLVEDSDELLQVTLELEVYSMYGDVKEIDYTIDDSYIYGGNIFY